MFWHNFGPNKNWDIADLLELVSDCLKLKSLILPLLALDFLRRDSMPGNTSLNEFGQHAGAIWSQD